MPDSRPSTLASDLADLIEAARRNSDRAFEELYHQTVREVRNWIAYRSHGWHMVDECLQQTYVTAFRHIGKFDGRAPFTAWLVGIARNEIGKYLDRRRRQSRGRERLVVETQIARHGEPSTETEAEPDLGERLDRCLDRLSPAVRAMVGMRYVENRPVQAIASATQRSANAISVTLHRARQTLRRCLEQTPP